MANGIGRIPVPLKNRWRQFRYSTLPVLGLVFLLASTFWLWNRAGEIPTPTARWRWCGWTWPRR